MMVLFSTVIGRRDRRLLVLDSAIAAGAFAGSIALLSRGSSWAPDARSLDAGGVVLAMCASLPIAVWRRSPLVVFALTTSASAVLNGLGYAPGPPLGPTAALFLLAASGNDERPWTRRTTAVVAGLFAVHVGAVGGGQKEFPALPLLFGVLVWTIAWFAGDRARLRRERIAALEERVARADRDRERERRLAKVEERTRIARDLHDSAGHAINVILVHAGAARLLQERDPERARIALGTIEEVARDTITEIDQLVRTLRDDPGSTVEVADAPGLAALGALVERHRAAGLEVTVESGGSSRPLGATADQAAYRIVQESLTNASRHGTGSALVELAFVDGTLELTITNAVAPGARASAAGHGLSGMRERATLAGGTLETETGGESFRVQARLPTRGMP
jgi:signal transduction histidine kinase